MQIKEDFLDCFNVLAEPTEVFRRSGGSQRWWVALVFISIVCVITTYFRSPLQQIALERLYENSSIGKSGTIALAIQRIVRFSYIGEFVTLVLRCFVMSALILVISSSLFPRRKLEFGKAFSTIVYSEVIFALMNVITLLLLYARGLGAINSPEDLNISYGLDMVMSVSDPRVRGFIQSINLFSIWYVITISIGISVHTEFGKVKSILCSLSAYLLWISGGLLGPHILGSFLKRGSRV